MNPPMKHTTNRPMSHPMRKLRPRALAAGCLLVALLLSLVVLRGHGSGHAAGDAPAAPQAALPVPVTPVVRRTVPIYLEYVGTTDAIRSVTLEAQVTGYLQRYAVADGAEVRRGQLLYQIDPRAYRAALDQVQAQAQRDAAAHEYAAANHARNAGLSATGDVSLDTLQQSASTETQEAAAQAADRAAIETAQLNLGYTSIRAPFDGRLSLTQVHEGALVTVAGTQLNTLVQLDPIYATFNPPDADLPQIQRAQAAQGIRADVLLGNASEPAYHGSVSFLDNTINRSTGTITVRATIANPSHSLLPGQFVRVRLRLGEQPGALLVPQIAVQSSQLGQYLYVVGPQDTAQQRFVTLGDDYGSLVRITQGVTAGEVVIVGNLLRVNPGETVTPSPAPPASPTPTAPHSRTRDE